MHMVRPPLGARTAGAPAQTAALCTLPSELQPY
eukprot:COSAG04_NODE_25092_length_312_cov_0.713615_1_plen_32_part_01